MFLQVRDRVRGTVVQAVEFFKQAGGAVYEPWKIGWV